MGLRTGARYLAGLSVTALFAATLVTSGAALAQDVSQEALPSATAEPSADAPAPPPAEKPAAPAAKKEAAKTKKPEVLPWANAPLVPGSGETAETPEMAAAAAQCTGQFEASCRDLKPCAWVADVTLQDGTLVPARCVVRPPAPPKAAAKKQTPAVKPKKTAETPPAEASAPAAGAGAPAVKDALIRAEDVAPAPEKPKVAEEPSPKHEKAEKKAASEPPADVIPPPAEPAKLQEPLRQEPPKEAAAEVAPVEPAAKPKDEEKPEEKAAEAAKSPIVVKPPSKEAAASPGFGSFSTSMPGGDGAVVVTVPPSN